MKIAIHGTKGGFGEIFADDIKINELRRKSVIGRPIGSYAYSIWFYNNETYFEKYKIVRDDGGGDKRTGYIGFSVVIPNYKSLKGIYIKEILDTINDIYIEEGYIDERNNLKNVTENFDFIEQLKNKYNSHLAFNLYHKDLSSKEDAETSYIYYNSNQDLIKYFNIPYQREYEKYQRVFFVDEKYRDQENNPLNGLRHTEGLEITSKIKLNAYELVNFNGYANGNVKITITSGGKELKEGSTIDENDLIEVIYSKAYYESKKGTGTLKENGTLTDFLEGLSQQHFTFKKDITLSPEKKSIEFIVKNCKGTEITNAFMTLNSGSKHKAITTKSNIEFTGEELGKKWELKGEVSSENLKGEVQFTPSQSPSLIELVLDKIIEIKFQNAYSADITVIKPNNNIRKLNIFTFTFKNETIDKKWKFKIEHPDYETKEIEVNPQDYKKPIEINLEKRIYKIKIDKGGKELKAKLTTTFKDGRDVKEQIKPKKGYKFKKLVPSISSQGNILTAKFQKIPFYQKPLFIGIAAMFVLLLIGGYFLGRNTMNKFDDLVSEKQGKLDKIEEYLEKDELKLYALNDYYNEHYDPLLITKEDSTFLFRTFKKLGFSNESNVKVEDNIISVYQKVKKVKDFRRNVINGGKFKDTSLLDKTIGINLFVDTLIQSIKELDSTEAIQLSNFMKEDEVSKLTITEVNDYVHSYKELNRFRMESYPMSSELKKEREKLSGYFEGYNDNPDLSKAIAFRDSIIGVADNKIKELEGSEKKQKIKKDAESQKQTGNSKNSIPKVSETLSKGISTNTDKSKISSPEDKDINDEKGKKETTSGDIENPGL